MLPIMDTRADLILAVPDRDSPVHLNAELTRCDDPDSEVRRLAGVARFEQEIVPLRDAAKSLGLSRDDLRFLIEANLKKANLPLQKKSTRVVPYLLAELKVACARETPVCSLFWPCAFFN